MEPSERNPSSSTFAPKRSSSMPKIFGGGHRRSSRVEKKSAVENEGATERSRGHREAEPEENVRPQRASPEPQPSETQSSRGPGRRALTSERYLRSTKAGHSTAARVANRGAVVDDGDDEKQKSALYHTISEGGPKQKTIAELIVEVDKHENFRIPSDMIIANKGVDTRVCQQMRRLAKDGDLKPRQVSRHLVASVKDFEQCWRLRKRTQSRGLAASRRRFWKRACKSDSPDTLTWMSQLDVAECREFFLWLLVYFRKGSGKEGKTDLIKGFERLDRLFQEEAETLEASDLDEEEGGGGGGGGGGEAPKASELDELKGVQSRLRQPANRPSDGSGGGSSLGRAAAPTKKGSKVIAEYGNIFQWSGDTNMTDYELSAIDVQGLTPVVDVGGRRRKNEEWQRLFDEEMAADRLRMEQEKAEKAALEAAPAPERQRKHVSGARANPIDADYLVPEMDPKGRSKVARKFSEFGEDRQDYEAEAEEVEEERLWEEGAKRRKMLKRNAARGGPASD